MVFYRPTSPAVLRLLELVISAGKAEGIDVGMCGEMAATTHHIPLLLGLGMDELSMNPQSIPQIKRVIRSLDVGDARSQQSMMWRRRWRSIPLAAKGRFEFRVSN